MPQVDKNGVSNLNDDDIQPLTHEQAVAVWCLGLPLYSRGQNNWYCRADVYACNKPLEVLTYGMSKLPSTAITCETQTGNVRYVTATDK
jgi:hypothetical protein